MKCKISEFFSQKRCCLKNMIPLIIYSNVFKCTKVQARLKKNCRKQAEKNIFSG